MWIYLALHPMLGESPCPSLSQAVPTVSGASQITARRPRPAAVTMAGKSRLVPLGALLLLGALAFTRLIAVPPFEDEGLQVRLIWRASDAGEWLQPLCVVRKARVARSTPDV